jgi:hypothetical protein
MLGAWMIFVALAFVGFFGFLIGDSHARDELRDQHQAKLDEHMEKQVACQKDTLELRRRLHDLYYGQCAPVEPGPRPCESEWAARTGERKEMRGIAPVSCAFEGHFLWVNPHVSDDPQKWSFLCAPAPEAKDP